MPRSVQGAGTAAAAHARGSFREAASPDTPVTPGKSEESLLIRRVLGLDGEDQMPLDNDPLPEAMIARLRAWIDQGAPMPGRRRA